MNGPVYDDTLEGAASVRDLRTTKHKRNPEIEKIRNSNAYRKARNVFRAHCRAHHMRCYVCNGQIDYRLRYPHPQCWTLEHRTPIEDNAQLVMDISNWDSAHLECNGRKSNRNDVAFDLGTPSEVW